MKFLPILLVFCLNNAISGELSPILANKIADCIYKIEGGANTKYPYGIKSIQTNGNVTKARQICVQTIKNQYIRWQTWGKTNSFVNSLADRYCPPKADRVGNLNWKKNLNLMLDVDTKKVFN
jgi:hypothetical protein